MKKRLKDTLKTLEDLPIAHKVVNLKGPTVRTRDVIAQRDLDIDPDQIVKTIMFKSKKHGVFSVAVRGNDRVDYKKLKQLLDDKSIRMLRADEMRELGWEPGECCPLSIPDPLYVDEKVMEMEKINSGSGDLNYGLEYPTKAIVKLRENVQIVDVKEE